MSFAVGWELLQAITGWESIKAPDSKGLGIVYAKATYGRVLYKQFTVAAGGNTTQDFYSWTDVLGNAVTPTKLAALAVVVTGNGAVIKLEPGASNPLAWWLSGTAPVLGDLTPNATYPAGILLANPGAFTVSATARNVKFSNTGAASATVYLAAIMGD